MGVALSTAVEQAVIFIPAARGSTSHHNQATPLGGLRSSATGLFIMLNTAMTVSALYLVWRYWAHGPKAAVVQAWPEGWGFPYLVAITAYLMNAIKLKTPVLDRLNDEEFYQFCMDHRDLRIERDANHSITIMPPASSETGASNSELNRQLANWNVDKRQGKTFDSSAGFTLSTGAMLSPDASWIAQARWDALSSDDRRGFARICPDFVVELLSPTDRLTDTMRKMEHWLEAGAGLGWLVAPATESVYIFEPGQPVRPVVGFEQELVAGPLLPGFRLELQRLK